jgi:hypothetical protein
LDDGGERYEPEILDGEPPEEAGDVDWDVVAAEAKKPVPGRDGLHAVLVSRHHSNSG